MNSPAERMANSVAVEHLRMRRRPHEMALLDAIILLIGSSHDATSSRSC